MYVCLRLVCKLTGYLWPDIATWLGAVRRLPARLQSMSEHGEALEVIIDVNAVSRDTFNNNFLLSPIRKSNSYAEI